MFLNLLNLLLKCVWMVLSSQIKDNSMKSSKPSKSVALPRTFSAFYIIMFAVPFTKDVCLWFKETLFWNFLYGLFVIKVKASYSCIFKNVWVLPSFMYRFILLLFFFFFFFFITSILHTVLFESAQNKAVYQYHMVSEMTTRLLVIPNVFKIV